MSFEDEIDLELFSVFNDPIKMERIAPPAIQKRRPGRIPVRPDEDLNQEEFEKRILKRERNRKAAARCRSRRIEKRQILEDRVLQMKNENLQLYQRNTNLQKELENLKKQEKENLKHELKNLKTENLENYRGAFALTPMLLDETFDFPTLPIDTIQKVRSESFTEFINFLTTV